MRGGQVVVADVEVDTWVNPDSPPTASMIGEGTVTHWGGGLYQIEHTKVAGDVIV